jgi:hypothetical protein
MGINWLTRMRGLGLLAVAAGLGWIGLAPVNAQGPGMGMPKGGMGGMGMSKGGMGGMGMHKGGMGMGGMGMGGCGMGMGQGMSKGGMGMGGMGMGQGMPKGGMGGMSKGGMGMGGMNMPVPGMGQPGMARPGGMGGQAMARPGMDFGAFGAQKNQGQVNPNQARQKKDDLNDNQVQRALQERAKAIQAQKDRKLAENGAENK